MCIRGSEESPSCAANTTLWPQKTADILSYPKDMQRANQKITWDQVQFERFSYILSNGYR